MSGLSRDNVIQVVSFSGGNNFVSKYLVIVAVS